MARSAACLLAKRFLPIDDSIGVYIRFCVDTNTTQTIPVAMSVIDGQMIAAQAVQSGYSTTIIFTKGGAVFTTGNNSNGQLGDGTTNDSWVPIKAKYTNNLGTSVY